MHQDYAPSTEVQTVLSEAAKNARPSERIEALAEAKKRPTGKKTQAGGVPFFIFLIWTGILIILSVLTRLYFQDPSGSPNGQCQTRPERPRSASELGSFRGPRDLWKVSKATET